MSDQGPGLPADVAARVFERFYRGDPARSRRTGGVGLGLSIVAAIVEAHGGSVQCRSSEGAGATFEVRLPLRKEESSSADDATWAPSDEPVAEGMREPVRSLGAPRSEQLPPAG